MSAPVALVPPIDLDAVWAAHRADVGADRGDEDRLHFGDLHACDFATWQRINGEPMLANDAGGVDNFLRGHAYEKQVAEALRAYVVTLNADDGSSGARLMYVTHGREIEWLGIVGHIDFELRATLSDEVLAIIDCSTTAAKSTDWKYAHALKSAGYAVAVGAPMFAEWVMSIGFGGKVQAVGAHWFVTADWRERVELAAARITALAASPTPPEPEPPFDPVEFGAETWRCGRPGSGMSYCRAVCVRNARTPS